MRALFRSVLLALALFGPVSASAESGLMKQDTRILSLPDVALGPYVWTFKGKLNYSDEMFKEKAAGKDPLRMFWMAFRLMRDEVKMGDKKAGARARMILDYMLDEYQPADRSAAGIHWKYGFDYEGIKSGWLVWHGRIFRSTRTLRSLAGIRHRAVS